MQPQWSGARISRGSPHTADLFRARVSAPWKRARRSRVDRSNRRRGCLRGCRLLCRRLDRRRRRRRRRLRRALRRQQRHGVDVAVRIRGASKAQVDVRLRPLGIAARADRADDFTLRDLSPDRHAGRAEVHERDRPAVRSSNRQAQTLVRRSPGERDDPARGRTDVRACRGADVDAAMLAARVRVVSRDERPQHGTVDGPCPRRRPRRQHERGEQRDEKRVA